MADQIGFKSVYESNRVLDWLFGSGDPATYYFALMTVAPTPDGGGTEVPIGVGSYARVAKTNNVTNFPAAASGAKSNGTILDWGTATADWGTIVGVALYDAASGGNLRRYYVLSAPRTINNGSSFSIPVGSLVMTEA